MADTCDTNVDIAIVGGGLSGLMVALLLEELKLGSWVLLEANSERFGGRLMNTPSGIDVGAAWIFYGQRKMLDLSKKLGVKTFPQPGDPSTSRVAGGTVALPLAIASRLPPSSLRMGFEVTSCTQESPSSAITLASSSGASISASKVVFAVPPKLIHERVSFTPALPADKTRAMAAAHTWMAGVTKVVIEFPEKFWPEGATDTGLPRSGPGFQVYDGSTDAVHAITFFAMVPPDMDDATAGKQCAAQLAQVWSMQGLGEALVRRLKDFQVDPKARVTVHRWPMEKFTSVERDPKTIHPHPHPVRMLGRSEWDGKLLFASSEADTESPGLMEGAVGAAQRVVSELRSAK